MTELKNKYPVVLIHGMFGYGQLQFTYKVMPYFGFFSANGQKVIQNLGVDCVAPSMGPFTSAWNRSCEIYAQLFGGTVDYGKAHAEKYGMERYGRTYETPMLPQWGTTDENGDLIKVNLIGHSHGGPTARMFLELIAHGSAEERAATDPADLSPLFAGGHENWVHSLTTLASPFNGASCLEGRIGRNFRKTCVAICDFMNLVDVTPFRTLYDLRLEMYGLTPKMFDFKNVWKHKEFKKYFFENEDTNAYEMMIGPSREFNEVAKVLPNVYYFSHRGDSSVFDFTGKGWPTLRVFPPFLPLGFFLGRQNPADLPGGDKAWWKNDAVVNTISAAAPDNAPRRDIDFDTDLSTCEPGIWNVYPVEQKDHMAFVGWTQKKEDYAAFMEGLYQTVSSLPTVDP